MNGQSLKSEWHQRKITSWPKPLCFPFTGSQSEDQGVSTGLCAQGPSLPKRGLSKRPAFHTLRWPLFAWWVVLEHNVNYILD